MPMASISIGSLGGRIGSEKMARNKALSLFALQKRHLRRCPCIAAQVRGQVTSASASWPVMVVNCSRLAWDKGIALRTSVFDDAWSSTPAPSIAFASRAQAPARKSGAMSPGMASSSLRHKSGSVTCCPAM